MSEDQEESAAIWIFVLVEAATRARQGRPVNSNFRLRIAGTPERLRDLAVVEALLA